jgi:hypothetical protein
VRHSTSILGLEIGPHKENFSLNSRIKSLEKSWKISGREF